MADSQCSPPASFGLLRRAVVCAELCSRAYDLVADGEDSAGEIQLPQCAEQPAIATSVNVQLVHCELPKDHGFAARATQCGVWKVPSIGYVVAFKGTKSSIDWVTNLQHGGKTFSGRLAQTGLQLHDGMYRRAIAVADSILTALSTETLTKDTPVLLTGSPCHPVIQHAVI